MQWNKQLASCNLQHLTCSSLETFALRLRMAASTASLLLGGKGGSVRLPTYAMVLWLLLKGVGTV